MEASFRACNGVGNGGVSLRRIAAARLLSSRFGPSKSIHDLKVPALPEDLWYCALQGLLYGESPTARAAAGIAGAGRRATRAEAGAFAAEALLHINRTDDDSVGSHSSHSSSPESLASGEWPLTSHRLWTRVVPHAYRGCLQVLKRKLERVLWFLLSLCTREDSASPMKPIFSQTPLSF